MVQNQVSFAILELDFLEIIEEVDKGFLMSWKGVSFDDSLDSSFWGCEAEDENSDLWLVRIKDDINLLYFIDILPILDSVVYFLVCYQSLLFVVLPRGVILKQ